MARQTLPADTLFGPEIDQHRSVTDYGPGEFGNCQTGQIAYFEGQCAGHNLVCKNHGFKAGRGGKRHWNEPGRAQRGIDAVMMPASSTLAALNWRMQAADNLDAKTAGTMNLSSDISHCEAC